MDLEQISPNLNSFFILLGKIRQDPGDLPHFCIIKIVNMVASIVFFVLGLFLIVAFILNREVEEELQEVANFDLWSIFILFSGSDSLYFVFSFFSFLCSLYILPVSIGFRFFGSGIFSLVTATIFCIGALKVLFLYQTCLPSVHYS